MVVMEVYLKISLYNSSLSLHLIKSLPNSIPAAGMINQLKNGKQLTIFCPTVSMKLPKS